MSKTPSRLRKRASRSQSVPFPLDPNDATKVNTLQAEADAAKRKADRADATAADRKAAKTASTALDEFLSGIATVTFHLTSCGPKRAEKIMAKHPATADQQKEHAEAVEANGEGASVLMFDPERFPAALIAECIDKVVYTGDDPETIDGADLDVDDIADMFDEAGWSSMDGAVLFATCQQLTSNATVLSRDLVDRLGNG